MILNQILEAEVEEDIGKSIIDFGRYEAVYGEDERPDKAATPSALQLAGLQWLKDMQVNAYVDFCIWGPHHHRIMKLMRCIGVFITPTGEIIAKELPGPPSLSEWLKCYDIIRGLVTS